MNDYSNMSIEDLKELKENLLNQISNLNNTIKSKKTQINDNNLRLNPYYKDNVSCLKIVVNDGSGYIVTKVTPCCDYSGISQFFSNTIDFLKYYEICSKSDWEDALNRLNMLFKDANLKVKEL